MKFGVAIVPHDLEETAVSARLAEEQGFDYIGIPDSQSLWRELYLSLSVVANNTSRVRIGPTVTNALTRHPAVAASAIATLNEISGGRAFFGIGSGDSAILNLGLRPARLAELQEYIEALRAILSGDSYDYQGRSIHVQWSEKPVPIIMSAEGPKTLAIAGGIADAVIIHSGLTKDVLADTIARIRGGERAAGRPEGSAEVWAFAKCNIADRVMTPSMRSRWPWRHLGITLSGSPLKVRTCLRNSGNRSWLSKGSTSSRNTSNWVRLVMPPSATNWV